MAVQGNLDPTVLYAPKEIIEAEVQRVLDENADRPATSSIWGTASSHGAAENAIHMVECVHRLSQK